MIKSCALGRSCCWHSFLASRTLVMIETVSQIALTTQGERHWPSLVLSNCEIKRTPLRRTDKAGLLSKDQSVSLDFRSKVLCLMCVSYFMTLDNVFSFVCGEHLDFYCSMLCSGEMLIFNSQSALKCDTVSLAQKPELPNTASWGLTRCVPIIVWQGPHQWLFLHDGENIELLIFVVFDFSDDYKPLISSLLTCLHLSL